LTNSSILWIYFLAKRSQINIKLIFLCTVIHSHIYLLEKRKVHQGSFPKTATAWPNQQNPDVEIDFPQDFLVVFTMLALGNSSCWIFFHGWLGSLKNSCSWRRALSWQRNFFETSLGERPFNITWDSWSMQNFTGRYFDFGLIRQRRLWIRLIFFHGLWPS